MRKQLFLSCLLMTSTSFAAELHNFAEIKSNIINGKQIRIVTDFEKCGGAKKLHFGVFSPNEIQIIDNRIIASFTHFTMNNPGFPDKAVYEFVKYTINDENNLILSHQTLSAPSYTPLTEMKSFTCKLDDGAKIYVGEF